MHKYYAQRRENASNCAQLRVQRQRSLGWPGPIKRQNSGCRQQAAAVLASTRRPSARMQALRTADRRLYGGSAATTWRRRRRLSDGDGSGRRPALATGPGGWGLVGVLFFFSLKRVIIRIYLKCKAKFFKICNYIFRGRTVPKSSVNA